MLGWLWCSVPVTRGGSCCFRVRPSVCWKLIARRARDEIFCFAALSLLLFVKLDL